MAGCSAMLMVDVFTNKFYSLAEKQLVSLGGDDTDLLGGGGNYTVVVGSSHGWIAIFSYDEVLELFLWNPVTRRCINLPPVDNLPTPKNEFDGGYCKVTISKLILSSSNPEDADCRVVVLYGLGSLRLAFCCPGQCGADWISIGTSWWYHHSDDNIEHRFFEDMAYSSQHNRLFCMTGHRYYELERWDLEDPWSPRMDGNDDGEVIYEYMEDEDAYPYLVIAGEDEVLVVVRKCYEAYTTGFTIFKVVQGDCGNIVVHPLHSLNSGLSIFIGLNHSFALSATKFPELKPNSIYFTDRIFDCKHGDIGTFNYQSRILYPCYSPQEHNGEDNDGSIEEHNADNDGSDEEHNGEAEDDGSDEEYYGEDGVYRANPIVWFRPSSHQV